MKSVVIFGATSVIATACARRFAAEGCKISLVARNAHKLAPLVEDLTARGAAEVHSHVYDLDRVDQHKALFEEIEKSLGQIDLVFIAYATLGNTERARTSVAEAEAILRTNFFSVVSLLTIAATKFEAEKRGKIAVISSVAGDRGRQSNYVYGTSKGALNIFLQGLRNRLAPAGVQVLTIKPGFVDTPMAKDVPKGPLVAAPDTVARDIVRALKWNFNTLYTPWFWLPIMLIIRSIPECIFKRLKL